MANISINNLDSEIRKSLNEYKKEISDGIKKVTHEVSENFKENTKKDAPKGNRKKFYKNIDVKTTQENFDGVIDTWYVKDPEYRLTHLIKNGHQTKNGGRTKSNDFIDKNYEIAEHDFENKVKVVIQNEH